jgi:putative MATE family efflux protein
METTSKRKSGTTDLTVGKPLFQILRFALPLVLGTLFQQLYSFADTVIVGRCLGTDALGAVGTTYSLNFLILGFVQGACVGFGIPVAETFGAKDKGGLRKYLFNGALLCVVLSVVFTISTTLMAGPLLQLIHTPEELYADAVLYIRIIFLGIPATVLYNYASSVLRAMGDSQHPFYFLLAASVLNIGLDYLLIVPMGMGVDGAALATVLSQLLSGGLCAFWFFTRTAKQEELTFRGQSSLLSAGHCKRLAYIGFPMGFEYSVSAIGAVIMQDAINLLGSTAVAAQTAGEKIRQMFTLPMESVGMAMATYVGQNHGAHRTDRIKQGIKDGCTIQLTYCVAAWVVIFFVKPYAVGLVLGDADPAVTAGAIQYLAIMSMLFCFHGLLMIFRNTLQGLGYSVQAIISGVGELIGRSLGGLLAVKTGLGYVGICLSNPFAWGLAMLYCMFMVRRMLKREAEN